MGQESVCKVTNTESELPTSLNIWQAEGRFFFEKAGGIEPQGLKKTLSFEKEENSIAGIIPKDSNNFYFVTRNYRGYSLYHFKASDQNSPDGQLKLIYKKVLKFEHNNQKYSSSLVDIKVRDNKVFIATNFDVLEYELSSFLEDGKVFNRFFLGGHIESRPDRVVKLRMLNDVLQAISFVNNDLIQPYISFERSLSSSSRRPSSSYLSERYMRSINQHYKHEYFIVAAPQGNMILSDREKSPLIMQGYVEAVDFDSTPDLAGKGVVYIRVIGLSLFYQRKEICNLKLSDIQQVYLLNNDLKVARIMIRENSGKVKILTVSLK